MPRSLYRNYQLTRGYRRYLRNNAYRKRKKILKRTMDAFKYNARLQNYNPMPPPGSLGKTFKCRLKYVDKIGLNPGTSAGTAHTFRANDLYDPDYTGTGHQPIAFDEYMNFYHHFTVLGSKLKATFISTGNASTDAWVVGVQLNGSTTATTTINDLYEQSRQRMRICGNNQGGRPIATVTKGFSAKKFFGQNPMDEDANAGTASGSPSEVAYYHVWATSTDHTGTDDPGIVRVLIEIEYVVVLHEPKNLAGS